MQHVIQPGELARSLDGKNIVRFLHHANGSAVAMRIAAEVAQLAIADVIACHAEAELVLHIHQRRGQPFGLLARGAQHMKCEPLRGLLADARQALELLDQTR